MRITSLLLFFMLAACGANLGAPAAPTAAERQAPAGIPPTIASTASIPTIAPSATAALPAVTPPASPMDQYRAWMAEARVRHPYSESVEQMWEVMLCESSGNPDLVAGSYHGLFQYAQETWEGDWNPYRDRGILDPQAQIFATAKAWHDGHQSWWGCYRG